MNRNPVGLVYQMCVGTNPEGTVFGWIFPTEVQAFMTPAYTVQWNSLSYWPKAEFRCPGLLKGGYLEFELVPQGDMLVCKHEKFEKPVRFSFGLPFERLSFRGEPFARPLPYVGSAKLVERGALFMELVPLDLELMSKAVLKGEIVLVGRTPRFHE